MQTPDKTQLAQTLAQHIVSTHPGVDRRTLETLAVDAVHELPLFDDDFACIRACADWRVGDLGEEYMGAFTSFSEAARDLAGAELFSAVLKQFDFFDKLNAL